MIFAVALFTKMLKELDHQLFNGKTKLDIFIQGIINHPYKG